MTHALRIAIADDEAVARQRLVRLLGGLAQVEVVLVCDGGHALLAALDGALADVLLLDIQMPGMTGLEAQAQLGPDAPYVIYVTAHPEHAIDAFDAGAIDYVLKPVDEARLGRAIERAGCSRARRCRWPGSTAPRGWPSRCAAGSRCSRPNASRTAATTDSW